MDSGSLLEGLNDEDRPFFDGLSAGELRLPWCDACGDGIWPPRTRCPRCFQSVEGHRALSGRGTVYSFSIVHRGDGPFAGREPYAYAYVRLDEGPVIPANIVGPGVREIIVGAHVSLAQDAAANPGLEGATFVVESR